MKNLLKKMYSKYKRKISPQLTALVNAIFIIGLLMLVALLIKCVFDYYF